MSLSPRLLSRLWIAVLVGTAGFLFWNHTRQIQRIVRVSAQPVWSVDPAVVDPRSTTGWSDGRRQLLLPEQNQSSYEWIAQTQQMLAEGTWRVRRVNYDNAPFGRATHLPALYRWWLALLAMICHGFTDAPSALCVERAALFADPILQGLILLGVAVYAARQFGDWSAALVSIAVAGFYPFAGSFLPGAPEHHGLLQACVVGSVLPLLGALATKIISGTSSPPAGAALKRVSPGARAHFAAAGAAGGLGLWLGATVQAPVLGGIVAGATAAVLLNRKFAGGALAAPWRLWALCGAVVSLAGYAIEYFPDDMSLRLQGNHPLYAIAWLACGEALHRLVHRSRTTAAGSNRREQLTLALSGLLAVGSVAALGALGGTSAFSGDPLASRLTLLGGGVAAPSLAQWIARDGFTAAVWATCLPLSLLALSLWTALGSRTPTALRAAILVGLAPALIAVALGCAQLRWWNTVDAVALCLLAVASGSVSTPAAIPERRGWWAIAVSVAALAGIFRLVPSRAQPGDLVLTEREVQGMIARDLGQWLRVHAGESSVTLLAPPELTASAAYHGGVQGVGTLAVDNQEGIDATVRVMRSSSAEEAAELVQRRGITHLVIPSWDDTLTQYARFGSNPIERTFIGALDRADPPRWLRPLPYLLPSFSGLEPQSLRVFQVVPEADESVALSWRTEYFVETGQLDAAAALRPQLRRYPAALSVLAALAQVEYASQDKPAYDRVMGTIATYVSSGADRTLRWDRRVSLALALAQAKRMDLARAQAERCLSQINPARVRSLTTGTLFRFLVLCRLAELEIADPAVRELALQLLPPQMRQRIPR